VAYARGAAAVEQSTWAGEDWGESSAASSLAHIDCSHSAVRSRPSRPPVRGTTARGICRSNSRRIERSRTPSTCKAEPCCVERRSEEGLIDEFGYEEARRSCSMRERAARKDIHRRMLAAMNVLHSPHGSNRREIWAGRPGLHPWLISALQRIADSRRAFGRVRDVPRPDHRRRRDRGTHPHHNAVVVEDSLVTLCPSK
jgi:hypothetical protein